MAAAAAVAQFSFFDFFRHFQISSFHLLMYSSTVLVLLNRSISFFSPSFIGKKSEPTGLLNFSFLFMSRFHKSLWNCVWSKANHPFRKPKRDQIRRAAATFQRPALTSRRVIGVRGLRSSSCCTDVKTVGPGYEHRLKGQVHAC